MDVGLKEDEGSGKFGLHEISKSWKPRLSIQEVSKGSHHSSECQCAHSPSA